MRKIVLLAMILVGMEIHAARQHYDLESPNGKLKVEVNLNKRLSYKIFHSNYLMLDSSLIGLTLKDGVEIGNNPHVIKANVKRITDKMHAPFYRCKEFSTICNELNLKLEGEFGVIFRIYNEGVAYRFYTTQKKDFIIKNEDAEFKFSKDFTAYLPYSTNEKKPFAMAFQNIYDVTPLSKAKNQLAFLPATVDCGKGLKVTILESDLENYPGMFVKAEGKSLKGVFAPYPAKTDYYPWRKQEYVTKENDYIARVGNARTFPWRILAITENDTEMPVNNLVYALASPNRIDDSSWIKPGQVAWDWWNDWGLKSVDFKAGINQKTYKYYIDFATKNHIPYIILDEGWYNPKSGDMLTVIPELNLPELVAYGKNKEVDIVLWTVFNVLDKQLEAACQKYAAIGIKGFKVDFLDRDDQTAVEMTYRIAEATAKHHLILDLHGFYKPTGLNRTYPNILNLESVFGMEEMKWNADKKDMPFYDVTFPFIRMMAGPVDYTPGAMRNASKADYQPIYYHPMSMGTRCHQLATYIVYDSPLTMLCDAPTSYEKEPECVNLITSIPVDVDTTRILNGELGKYIITARKKTNNWYVGGLTNWDERDVTIDFSFLQQGKRYLMTLFEDGINANKSAEDYKIQKKNINYMDKLNIHMASGGGFVIKLEQEP